MSYMLALRQLEELDHLEPRAPRARHPAARQSERRARMASRPNRPAPMSAEISPRGAEQAPMPRAGDSAVLWEALRRAPDRLVAAYAELDEARSALAAPNHPNPDSLQAAIERHAAAEDQIDAIHRQMQVDWEAYKSVSTFVPSGTEVTASDLAQNVERDPLAQEVPGRSAGPGEDPGITEARAEVMEPRQPEASPAEAAAPPAARLDERVQPERVIASRVPVPQAVEMLLAAIRAEARGVKGRRAVRERERVLLKRVSAQIRRGAAAPAVFDEPNAEEGQPPLAGGKAFAVSRDGHEGRPIATRPETIE